MLHSVALTFTQRHLSSSNSFLTRSATPGHWDRSIHIERPWPNLASTQFSHECRLGWEGRAFSLSLSLSLDRSWWCRLFSRAHPDPSREREALRVRPMPAALRRTRRSPPPQAERPRAAAVRRLQEYLRKRERTQVGAHWFSSLRLKSLGQGALHELPLKISLTWTIGSQTKEWCIFSSKRFQCRLHPNL